MFSGSIEIQRWEEIIEKKTLDKAKFVSTLTKDVVEIKIQKFLFTLLCSISKNFTKTLKTQWKISRCNIQSTEE